MRLRPLVLLSVWGLCGCHPFKPWSPPKPEPEGVALDGAVLGKTEVLLDARGIPHVYAENETDAAFAVGFMHAYHRQFQLLALKHASQGRLTEVFGKDALPLDRRLRILTFRLEEFFAGLSSRDRALLEAYANGVNRGATYAGRGPELALLGLEWSAFTAQDAAGTLRLQAWLLSFDVGDELLRARILEGLSPNDPRRGWLDAPCDAQGAEIIPGPKTAAAPMPPSTLAPGGSRVTSWALPPKAQALAEAIGLDAPGASNSWVVDGAHTKTGRAMVVNDPHLGHALPSPFYLAHVVTPQLDVVGATFPGGPAVLIGAAKDHAWAMTASYADVQDLLWVKETDDGYELDGEKRRYVETRQSFRLGRKAGDDVVTEVHRQTALGPVLPPAFGAPRPVVLLWPGFEGGGLNANPISGFFDLAAAKNLEEATAAVSRVRVAAANVSLAFSDGHIAYRLASLAPKRPGSGRVPRDGSTSASAFSGSLEAQKLPRLDRPASGYIVTANQRVVSDAHPSVSSVGDYGMTAHRARRITERLDTLMAAGKPDLSQLLDIQQDATSTEGRELSKILGAHCAAPLEPGFCAAVRGFDGHYSVDSMGALPFTLWLLALRQEVVRTLGPFDEESVKLAARLPLMQHVVERALRAGPSSPIWRGEFDAVLTRAAVRAIAEGKEKAGDDLSAWRWGRVHRLTHKSPLSAAPVVGSAWAMKESEQSGWSTAPRAEAHLPVETGAVFRMAVEVGTDDVRMTLDTGQGGSPGAPHLYDMSFDWNAGLPPRVPLSREEIDKEKEGRFVFSPAAAK